MIACESLFKSYRAGHGRKRVLENVNLRFNRGDRVGLLGRNGAGKTTLIESLVGLTTWRAGTVHLAGTNIARLAPERRARAGIGWIPQERGIFKSLTVEENLTAIARPGPWTVQRAYQLFPRLAERKRNLGDQLSGGEQQMLAIARALMARPRLLLLDEPSLGLAPMIVRQIFDAIRELNRTEKLTVFLVEQNAFHALKLAHRGYVMVNGVITLSGTGKELLERPEVKSAYLEGGRQEVEAGA